MSKLRNLLIDKRILLVIHDNMELRLLLSQTFLSFLEKATQVDITLPVSKDEMLLSGYKILSDMEFINIWPDRAATSFHWKIIYKIKKFCFFVRNSFSLSARQKLLLSIGFPLDVFFYKNKHFFYKIAVILAHCLGGFCSVGTKCTNNINAKKTNKFDYDFIIFGRHDSFENTFFYINAYDKTKFINFIRNIDAISLKGSPSVNADYTVCYNDFICNQVKTMLLSKEYGEIIKIEYPLKDRINSFNKSRNRTEEVRKVLFATTSSHFYPEQPAAVKMVYEILSSKYDSYFQLYIQKHVDDKGDYSFLRNESNIKVGDVPFQKCKSIVDDRFLKIPSQKDNNFYVELLCSYDVVITVGSTIAQDFLLLNKKVVFWDIMLNGINPSYLYDRDHLKFLICEGAKIVCHKYQLKEEL